MASVLDAMQALGRGYRKMLHRVASTHHQPVTFEAWAAQKIEAAFHDSMDIAGFVTHLIRNAESEER